MCLQGSDGTAALGMLVQKLRLYENRRGRVSKNCGCM